MITLLVGLSIVAVSAIGFWLVLFSHNPASQGAPGLVNPADTTSTPESAPRSAALPAPVPNPRKPAVRSRLRGSKGAPGAIVPAVSVRRRARSALILLLATVGTAALIGAILSVVVVVTVMVVT